MKDEELAAMQARVDAVTPGPWRISGDESVYSDDETMEWAAETTDDPGIPSYPPERHTADAAFIAAARADIPALLVEVEAWREIGWAVVQDENTIREYYGDYGPLVCVFSCVGSQTQGWNGVHSSDCPVTKACALLDIKDGSDLDRKEPAASRCGFIPGG